MDAHLWPTTFHWCQFRDRSGHFVWQWLVSDIMDWKVEVVICFKEIFLILVALAIWGLKFANKWIRLFFFIDKEGTVSIINTAPSKCPQKMCLICPLALLCLQNNIMLHAVHTSSTKNSKADSLSCFQNLKFQSLHPTVHKSSTPIRQHLFDLCWVCRTICLPLLMHLLLLTCIK